jgi:hypothetical protein
MQMAVFRDASWDVAGGWTPSRFGQILDASQFPGSDIGAKANAAYSACASTGCNIRIPAGQYSFSTTIGTGFTPGKPVVILCDEGADSDYANPGHVTNLIYTGTGTAVTIPTGTTGSGMRGCGLYGPGLGGSTIGLLISGAVHHTPVMEYLVLGSIPAT